MVAPLFFYQLALSALGWLCVMLLFVLPHASLRQPLLAPEPLPCSGSAKRWRPWTLALAAALTDHVGRRKEVLL